MNEKKMERSGIGNGKWQCSQLTEKVTVLSCLTCKKML